MIHALILERKCLKNTFYLMVKLFQRSCELNVVKHTFGPNRPYPVTSHKGGMTMPVLSDPHLHIEVSSGSSDAKVTASVDVTFSPQELALINLFEQAGAPLRYKVTCRIRGADGFANPDNALFTLGNVMVHTNRNNIPFLRVVHRDLLDEDSGSGPFSNGPGDEVYARFWCTAPTNTGLALADAHTVDSPEVPGSF